jgi:hypothetical protein
MCIYAMVGKVIRWCILICITCISIWIGHRIYTVCMELFAFQLTFYEWMLQSQQFITTWQEQLQWVRDSALELLGKEQHATDIPQEDISMNKLQEQAIKLQNIARSVWWIVGILIWKILFDIVFWIKKSIQDVKEFIL